MSIERDLRRELRQILFEMKWLLPWGSITNYHASGAHGVPGSRAPGGEGGEMPHVYWSREWDKAKTELERKRVVERARTELDGWRKRPATTVRREETADDLARRMVVEGRGWDVKEVAQHFNCTPTFVRRVRVSAGVNATTGEPSPASSTDTIGEAEHARQLAEAGLTERQMRMILKCGGSKLQRLLGRAA